MTQSQLGEIPAAVVRDAAGVLRVVGALWIALALVYVATLTWLSGFSDVWFPMMAAKLALIGAGVYTLIAASRLEKIMGPPEDQRAALTAALPHLRRLFVYYAAALSVDALTSLLLSATH